jgi:hypothetical protein
MAAVQRGGLTDVLGRDLLYITETGDIAHSTTSRIDGVVAAYGNMLSVLGLNALNFTVMRLYKWIYKFLVIPLP